MKKYIEGIKFGLILQFAIGPMCLMVFNTAKNSGFFIAELLVFIIALVDVFYITIACLFSNKLLEHKKFINTYRIIGSIIIMLLGLNIILNVFNINIIPGISINRTFKSIFIEGLVLALSNPITIVFWTSVLTAKLTEEKMKKRDLIKFCMGLVSATLLFLSFVNLIGVFVSRFIINDVAFIINILVGLVIMYFGFKTMIGKN